MGRGGQKKVKDPCGELSQSHGRPARQEGGSLSEYAAWTRLMASLPLRKKLAGGGYHIKG